MGLELLTALAEESEVQLSRAARTAMLESIGEAAPEVLQLLGAVLAANLAAQGVSRRALCGEMQELLWDAVCWHSMRSAL